MIYTFEELKNNSDALKRIQSLLSEAMFYLDKIDGIWGPNTERAIQLAAKQFYLNTFQIKKVGPTFIDKLKDYIEQINFIHRVDPSDMKLSEQDYEMAAKKLGLSPEHIKAVAIVESTGDGFLDNGFVKILFEAHWFAKLTNHVYNNSYPNISSRSWDRSLYYGGENEYIRLNNAMKLDKLAALKSASWGSFQIMGFNHQVCGYKSVIDFVNANHTSKGQLDCLVNFIKFNKLDKYLRSENWAKFAERYNGPGYRVNKYDTKLAREYYNLTHK